MRTQIISYQTLYYFVRSRPSSSNLKYHWMSVWYFSFHRTMFQLLFFFLIFFFSVLNLGTHLKRLRHKFLFKFWRTFVFAYQTSGNFFRIVTSNWTQWVMHSKVTESLKIKNPSRRIIIFNVHKESDGHFGFKIKTILLSLQTIKNHLTWDQYNK